MTQMTKSVLTVICVLCLACTDRKITCSEDILNLDKRFLTENLHNLDKFTSENSYLDIKDSIQLLKYLDPVKEAMFFRELHDTAIGKIRVREGLIIERNYHLDVFYLPGKLTHFWLKTYDSNHKPIGEYHFAGVSEDSVLYTGRIDCNYKIYQDIFSINESSVYQIDRNGKFIHVPKRN